MVLDYSKHDGKVNELWKLSNSTPCYKSNPNKH